MPNPKHRHSKSRQAKRRANWNYRVGNFAACPQCHESKRPHRVCPHCGYYRGIEIVAPVAAE
jgi:large subunit ribosomal protein L32